MNRISDFNGIVEYVERHLRSEISVEEMARLAALSVYEFRRIFSFVAGISVSEYVRRRRLSAAAEEILTAKVSVSELARKYGYDTPASFSRAFKEFHGISPTRAAEGKDPVRLYTKISFDLRISGGRELACRITEEGEFWLKGYSALSDQTDTECCEGVWNRFYASGEGDKIPADGSIYAAYENRTEGVYCTVGQRGTEGQIHIPACRWACFPMNRTDDAFVNETYKTILYGWLKASGFRRAEGVPNLEVYPADMEREGFGWEIRIPLER